MGAGVPPGGLLFRVAKVPVTERFAERFAEHVSEHFAERAATAGFAAVLTAQLVALCVLCFSSGLFLQPDRGFAFLLLVLAVLAGSGAVGPAFDAVARAVDTGLARLGLERTRSSRALHLWDFNDPGSQDLDWRYDTNGDFERASLPEDHELYGKIVRLVETYGGKNCARQRRLCVTSVDAVRNWKLMEQFEGHLDLSAAQRREQTGFFRRDTLGTLGSDPQKAAVHERFKTYARRSATFLDEDPADVALLVTLHGASEKAVGPICAWGAKDLRRTDPGYAGAGIYSTVQAEYAALYSGMSRSRTMVLCVCAVGNVYPISRSADYAMPCDTVFHGHSKFYSGTGAALKPGYDAHWFCVHQPEEGSLANVECYLDPSHPAHYDEVVVKEEKQVLPIAVVRFAPTDEAPKADGVFR